MFGLQPLPACHGSIASLSRSTLGASGEPQFHVNKNLYAHAYGWALVFLVLVLH